MTDWHKEQVEEGIRDAEAGNLTGLEDVKAKWVKKAEYRKAEEADLKGDADES